MSDDREKFAKEAIEARPDLYSAVPPTVMDAARQVVLGELKATQAKVREQRRELKRLTRAHQLALYQKKEANEARDRFWKQYLDMSEKWREVRLEVVRHRQLVKLTLADALCMDFRYGPPSLRPNATMAYVNIKPLYEEFVKEDGK